VAVMVVFGIDTGHLPTKVIVDFLKQEDSARLKFGQVAQDDILIPQSHDGG